ncbi:MAG: hypothetical protein KKB31_05570, partial [Nanoarchaeota archaeon]|nr:hypothetical protein [Nanoarchaeota archaeon]
IEKRIKEVVTLKDSEYFKSLDTYKSSKLTSLTGNAIANPAQDYNYVIITTNQFKGEWDGNCGSSCTLFSCLIKQKRCRLENPITATIVTKEEILADSDYGCNSAYIVNLGNSIGMDFSDSHCGVVGHDDDASKIRNFIRDAYVNWNTEYVVLGGDADIGQEIIPVRGLFDDLYLTLVSSDLYYSCLEGSFDYDGDGVFGELDDGVGGEDADFLAEVYVGRVPVDDEDEINTFVDKIIVYENLGVDSFSHLSNVLMVGESLGLGGPAVYANLMLDEVHEGSTEHSYLTSGYPSGYNVDFFYEADGYWSKDDLKNRINQDNLHMINHLGHGQFFRNMKLEEIMGDLDDLTNNNNKFFGYSEACDSGKFVYDSIIECMVLGPNRAFGYIANSGIGIGTPGSTDFPSTRYHREFIDALFSERILNFGKANQDSKEDNLGSLPSNEAYVWWGNDWALAMEYIYYSITLFGDPETSIKIPEPDKPVADLFIDRSIFLGSVEIVGSALEGFSDGADFDNYILEYRHEDDVDWSSLGIILTNGGSLPVNKGVLATWDSTQTSNGLNILRLTSYGGGLTSRDEIEVEVNNDLPCDCGVWGDLNGDGAINPVDVVFMINKVYLGNDQLVQPPNCPLQAGDVNCDGNVNPVDVVFMVNYVYLSNNMFCDDPCLGGASPPSSPPHVNAPETLNDFVDAYPEISNEIGISKSVDVKKRVAVFD